MVFFGVSAVFHLLVMTGIIDFHIVWGGRLKDREEMLVFESISLITNGLFLWITAQRIAFARRIFPEWLLRVLFGLMTVLFVLNTLGNLVSLSRLEMFISTPITAISAACCLLLALGKETIST